MKPEIKAKWVAALRSGKYQQGTRCLKNDKDQYCCLGVLCDLHAKLVRKKKWKDAKYGGVDAVLTERVRNWAGLRSRNPEIDGVGSLAHLNDNGFSFGSIANMIEGYL